jgi:hypothetical protein
VIDFVPGDVITTPVHPPKKRRRREIADGGQQGFKMPRKYTVSDSIFIVCYLLFMNKYSLIDCLYLSSYVRLYEMPCEKQQGI